MRRLVKFYNLDAILAVGDRIRSLRGTQFRRWATERLREYLMMAFLHPVVHLRGHRSSMVLFNTARRPP